MKDVLRAYGITFGPWIAFMIMWSAFMYLAPCGCMGGCSAQSAPSRCVEGGSVKR